jgi:uncharacterized protein (DUF362 family)
MAKDNSRDDSLHPCNISRRHFIKLAAATGLLAGCSPTQQPDTAPTVEPTTAPTTEPTIEPTAELTIEPTIEPTSTPLPTMAPRRQEIIKMYPDVPSKVVYTRHAGAWDGETLTPEALRQMLDAAITALTDLNDATAAWAALFAPDERIAIKTNSHPGGSTHVPLVIAVTERLQAAGVPAEQILVFDRYSIELEDEGYPVNQDGPGVRCHGTDLSYVAGWTLMGTDIELSDLVLNCDALINIPILKAASGPGISFAMKNHYGTFDKPSNFHRPKFERALAELNALPPIKSRTRLIVGDALTVNSRRDTAGYRMIGTGDSILMSFDPVAHDTIGLQLVSEVLTAEGKNSEATIDQATPWLKAATEMEVGTNDPNHIELVEVTL